jgi:hypothetical protein
MMAVEALQLARSYGCASKPIEGLCLEAAAAPPDVSEALRAAKPDLLRILAARPAAEAVLAAAPPEDCSSRRLAEVHGLQAFVASGWADQALLLGWTPIELYRVSFDGSASISPAPRS